jgi:glycosyltransferase involved in cell wall biosynthesis
MLQGLLLKLSGQKTYERFTFSIIIVDNDKKRSAKESVEKISKTVDIPILYFNEPEQNISLARNMALKNATGDYIALIDDDEFPDENWLYNMITSIQEFKVDGILGPVLPHFDFDPPEWVIREGIYRTDSHKTGDILSWTQTRTSNVFMKRLNDEDEFKFMPEFGQGGEDRDFFKRLIKKGYEFIWLKEAPVFENIPVERCRRKFFIKRALLRGQNSKITDYSIQRYAKSVLSVFIYTMFLPIIFLFYHKKLMRILEKYAWHIGCLFGIFDIKIIKEYYIMCKDVE